MALDQETIDLIINAENLTGDELAKVTKDLDRLGKEALEADQRLSKVTIEREQLNRFIELKDNISQLRKEVNKTETANKKYVESIKKSGKETAAQTRKLQNNKRNLADLNSALRSNKKEQDKVGESLKKSGVGIVRYNQSLKRLDEGYTKVRKEVTKTNRAFRKHGEIQEKTRVENEKAIQSKRKLIDSLHEEGNAINRLISDERKAHEINTQLIVDSEKQRIASQKLTQQKLREAKVTSDLAKQNRDISNAKKRQIEIDKKALAQAKEELIVKDKLRKRLQQHDRAIIKANVEKQKQIELDKKLVIENERVSSAIKKYNIELEKLNIQLKKGKISHEQFINSEIKLRKQLNLTEKQAKQTAIAINKINHAKARKSTDGLTKVTRRLAQAYTVLIAAQAAAGAVGATVKGYGELETAVTKVEKTTNLAKEELEELTKQLQIMGEEVTPTATTELLRYAEVAGQLGAESSRDILNIAEAADALGVSTNLAGEEAVTLLSRMLQMTSEGIPAIHNLSSSLVDLGNNFAANEAEIAQMTKEIITGTRAIDLGSAASAGFAAVLKELGQTGERSRSSFFRLSEAIAKASIEGGDDLKNLSQITKLSGEEIRESLGENSEKVLLAFVEGLARVKKEGGLVSEALEQFNITSIESKSVFGALASNSERLAEGVRLSTEAFKDGNKHLEEANKAYATQDSALARLNNKFITLKAVAGEAFADEVQEGITATGDALERNKEFVIELSNQVAELGREIIDSVQSLDAFANSLGAMEARGIVLTTLKIFVNDLQIGLDVLTASIIQVRIWWAEFTNASAEEIGKLRDAQDEAFKSMEGNIKDIQNAEEDWAGTSSATYRDLKKAATEHADVLHLLTEEERKNLKIALEKKDISNEGLVVQSALTEAIVKAVRVNDLLVKSKEKQLILEKKELENKKLLVEINASFTNEVENSFEILEKYLKQKEQGVITETRYKEIVKLVNEAYQDSIVTLTPLIEKYEDVDNAQGKLSNSNHELRISIISQKDSIKELLKVLNTADVSTDTYTKSISKLAIAKKKLALDQEKLTILTELEGKTVRELILIQAQHNLELEKIERNKRLGLITIAEYNIAIAETTFKTQFLNQALGENAVAHQTLTEYLEAERIEREKHLDVLREQNGLLDDNTDTVEDAQEANEQAATAVSLWAIARARLNKELDYSNFTTEELNDKTIALGKTMRIVRQTVGNWWTDLHQLNNQAVIREQTTIKETIALRALQEQVESGSLSLAQLEKASRNVQFSFRNLGDQQLDPLRDAIKDAREEFADLEDTINDSFNDIEDRLDAALGNEQAIVKRQFEREMKELLDLLETARSTGDNALINKINEAIRSLEQAQDLEFESQFGTNNPNNSNSNDNSNNDSNNSNSNSNNQSVTVTLNLNGVATSLDFANQSSADDFISAMEALGEVNSQGIG